MAKKDVKNTPFANYPILIKSYGENNSFNLWNKHVSKFPENEGPDLSHQNLEGFDLRGANLARANLTGCRLCGALLAGTEKDFNDLRNVNFTDANLADADLSNSLLNKAIFVNANLSSETMLLRSILMGSVWREAKVTAEQLSHANFTGAIGIPQDVATRVALMILSSLLPSNIDADEIAKLILEILMPEEVRVFDALFSQDVPEVPQVQEELSEKKTLIISEEDEEDMEESEAIEDDFDEDEYSDAEEEMDDSDQDDESEEESDDDQEGSLQTDSGKAPIASGTIGDKSENSAQAGDGSSGDKKTKVGYKLPPPPIGGKSSTDDSAGK